MGYEYVIILGENEAKKETVSLKLMASGQQREIGLNDSKELLEIIK
jgi:histidyl-tRNA synthetase